MESNFKKALAFVLTWEGGYCNDPDDPGGETNMGICKRSYPDLDIKNLTNDQVADIYHRDYWLKVGADYLPDKMDIVSFDTAVNCGVSRALQWRAVSADWEDLMMHRMRHYLTIVKRNRALGKFLNGWMNRCVTLWEWMRSVN